MTLAYVFWHRPREPTGYDDAMTAFHRALHDQPPPGFLGSWTLRVARSPHDRGGPAYEDWYLVEDWASVGVLNAAAVDAAHKAAHDVAARAVREGAGGLYRLIAGRAAPAETSARWLHTPPSDDATHAQLWQRQMVLGPAPEWVLVDAADPPDGLESGPRSVIRA